MILILVTFCFLVYGLFKSHMKIHKLNRLIKCWKCKKNKVAFDTGLYPTCWDCYGYEKVNSNYEHFEQYGYSIIDINI